MLSWDLVHKLVDLFDVKKPLKLEDVYIATLVGKLGVKAVRHHGFHSLEFGPCKHYLDTVVYHRASIQCMEELFNKAMQERVEHELIKLKSLERLHSHQCQHRITPKTSNAFISKQLVTGHPLVAPKLTFSSNVV